MVLWVLDEGYRHTGSEGFLWPSKGTPILNRQQVDLGYVGRAVLSPLRASPCVAIPRNRLTPGLSKDSRLALVEFDPAGTGLIVDAGQMALVIVLLSAGYAPVASFLGAIKGLRSSSSVGGATASTLYPRC